ncbi:MAG: hypothetical protein QOH61_2832 [Chloroflexota bacterium]|jgi:hypothetical protein|nr:hypothetical protein [Chloroflexota bacterium]
MSSPKRFLPRHATVIAYVALFSALGGGAYAAVSTLPEDSVGTAQLQQSAVTAPKLAVNSVNSGKVVDKSLTAKDFAPGQLPAGPTGPTGPAGAQGEQGPKGDQGPAGPGGLTFDNVPRGYGWSLSALDESTAANKAACMGAPIASANAEIPLRFGTYGGQIASTYGDCSNGWGMVIPKTGIYTVTLNVLWQQNPNGFRGIGIRRVGNGDTGYIGESRVPAANGTVTGQSVTGTDAFNAGDTIQFYAVQTSGGPLGVINDGRTSVEAHFVAPTH